MFEIESVKLSITEEALRLIAQKALDIGTGARALRMILENSMRDIMYDIPSDETISEVIVDERSLQDNKPTVIRRKDREIA